ncbi:hypothetical protein NHH03_22950 [Stieleria sp. TO1_6]|uniref:HEAT repeat domain-containing protein n=1 Tax=Stieleria tagensis TaxID=2956795 RepID=UPI00209AB31A|nr:hypothetical protein [Stieleria tagensis]MCO8124615.1 hypothetical protein [Stieleria tagensis]
MLIQPIDAGAADPNQTEPPIDQVDLVMYADPGFPIPVQQMVVPNDSLPLWQQALDTGDVELQRLTLDSISIAHQHGMQGLEIFVDPIVSLIQQPELLADVRLAGIKALIELDQRNQAQLLATLARNNGRAAASIIEPALTRWESDVLADDWLKRLASPSAGRQSMIRAAQGLAALQESAAIDPLKKRVADRLTPPDVRLAAADSLGHITDNGLQSLATELLERPGQPTLPGLLAASLLDRHTDAESIDVLKQLAQRPQTLVQSEALARLYAIDSNLLLEFATTAITSPDVNVRRWIGRALIDSNDVDRMELLCTLLDDVNPSLRQRVAAALVRLAGNDTLRDAIIAHTSGVLDQDAWRGCEQAAIVLVNLDHRAAGDRLVDLLQHPRGEVMTTAAWGLRRFGLKQHLPAMLGRAKSGAQIPPQDPPAGEIPDQLGPKDMMAQLFMAFGQMDFREAEELMRTYLPKSYTKGNDARAAAVWSLGYFYEDESPDELTKILSQQLADADGDLPELEEVRRMSAISLGRMNSSSAIAGLRDYAGDDSGMVSRSCHWAIEKITGEPIPPPRKSLPLTYDNWFLTPVPATDENSSK